MSTRRRSARPGPARSRLGSTLEVLEDRQLLSQTSYLPISSYPTSTSTLATNPGAVPSAYIAHPVGSDPSTLVGYSNEGKSLSGQDRQGNRWTLTLTGPGEIIVTDVTPNDSVLDDNLDTIRLIGTNIKTSSLVGQVEESARTPTDYTQLATLGELKFNALVADNGVKSIILNGFVLTDTVTQPGATGLNSTTGINLKGGVGNLAFEGINAPMPSSQDPVPIVVAIGSPTTPLTVKPTIRIDHIYNTVYDDTAFTTTGSGVIPTGPLTSPTVSLVVNGAVADFNVVSITQVPDLGTTQPEINGTILTIPTQFIPSDSAALEYQFPTVGTTGRTAIQATSIDNIKVSGAATNVTFSRAAQPFQSSLTGLKSLKSAQFGGPTDALAIDVKGNIGKLKFAKGLGNPAGLIVNPTNYGRPASANGYAASGNLGGQVVTEGNIGSIEAAANNSVAVNPSDPAAISAGLGQFPVTTSIAGSAFTTAIVAANGSIGSTHIVGDLNNTEIKSGYNYYSAIGGAEGVTTPSKIGPVKLRGNLIDSVVSATYRANDGVYGNGNDTAGDGTITGVSNGFIYQTATGTTALGNKGSGFFSRYTTANPKPKSTKVTVKAGKVTAAKK